MLLLSCLIPTQDQPGLYQCELCQWFVTESQRTRNFARVISDLFCRGTIRFFVRLWIIWKEMLIREAVLCDCYFPELPHLSFLFVLFDLCMNSNKTLAVCPHPCFLSLFCCLTLIRIEYFLQYMTVIFYNVLQTPLLSLAYHPSPSHPHPPASLWRPVGPTPGASPLVVWNRLIPQHGPSHSAPVTGAFFPVKKKEGCVCRTADWNTPVHRIPVWLNVLVLHQ